MTNIKATLRKQILSARKILVEGEWNRRNQRVQQLAADFILTNSFRGVHAFLPIARNREVDTWPVIRRLMEASVPVVISVTDFEKQEMHHYLYEKEIKFRLNRFHIPEPVNARTADLTVVDLILVPFLAADKKGNRIGYGKGYYDRLLATLPPDLTKVGLTVGSLFDYLPFAESHDIKLDYCITPYEIVKCNE